MQTEVQILETPDISEYECVICYKIAVNPHMCDQCQKQMCLKCCESIKKSPMDVKCPFCRFSPFNAIVSPKSEEIQKLELKCRICQQLIKAFIFEEHESKKCGLIKIVCTFCNELFPQKDIFQHTITTHQNQAQEIIKNFQFGKIFTSNPQKILDKNKKKLQILEKSPHLGTSGKFYCGKTLGLKCSCCNGYCGPTNGENCVDCMALDLQRFGCQKGQFVNSEGKVCWLQDGKYICGNMLGYHGENCNSNNQCYICRKMNTNIARYSSLL